jgi:hypothetical protein
MSSKPKRKLTLNKVTLMSLTSQQLSEINGATISLPPTVGICPGIKQTRIELTQCQPTDGFCLPGSAVCGSFFGC